MALNHEQRQRVDREYNGIQSTMEQLDELAKAYQQYGGQIKQLQREVENLGGLFNRKAKKEKTAQLEHTRQSRADAKRELQQSYGVEPKEVEQRLEWLADELAACGQRYNSIPQRADLRSEQAEVREQYRQEYEKAQDRPDAATILERVRKHRPPEVKSITGKMAIFQAERELQRQFPINKAKEPKQEHHHRRGRGGMDMSR
jgi:chromosome segregation ATPase